MEASQQDPMKKDINPVLGLFLILLVSLALTFVHLDQILNHLSKASLFDHSVLALFLILGFSLALTFVHTLQEWKGRGTPLWRNFGAVKGVWVPDWLGFPIFFLILTTVLWLAALVGITGNLLTYALPPEWTALALGALIGARLADTLISHLLLYVLGYRPNPGLASTPFYFIEAGFFVSTFSSGLADGGRSAWVGGLIGALPFIILWPLLGALRKMKPSWRRDPWRRGESPPAWAKLKT
jgi:hypothetical protein